MRGDPKGVQGLSGKAYWLTHNYDIFMFVMRALYTAVFSRVYNIFLCAYTVYFILCIVSFLYDNPF